MSGGAAVSPSVDAPSVIALPVIGALGNFDGVHRGHQALLAATAAFAAEKGAAAGAVVFDPHPRRFFQPDAPPFLVTSSARRDALLRAHGAGAVFHIGFNATLAARSPDSFVADVLKRELGLSGVVTGSDFRFGKARAGDAASLSRLCADHGLAALTVDPLAEAGHEEKIGTTLVRAAIAAGDMPGAARLLGRPWSVEGVVERGQTLGRTIGFPTANLGLGDRIEPRRGVYAVEIAVEGARYQGVANFGRRPTVGAATPLLEAHLFGFNGDLYGVEIDVSFIAFIRDECRFDGLEALAAQIARDCQAARAVLATV